MSAPWWPDRRQRLLVLAAVAPLEEAREAWRQWREEVDLDAVDDASGRLLPLVWRRLAEEAAGPDAGRLRGCYRLAWYRNQLLFRSAGDVLRGLHDAGLETLVLKGAALALLHYDEAGSRFMVDIDILVRTGRAADAIEVVECLGWQASDARVRDRLDVRHSAPFTSADGMLLDLHWNVLRQPADDGAFWDAAVPVTVGGVETRALCPTDQLLHVCGHAITGDAGIVWIADALTLMRGPIDWDRLVRQARARRLTLVLERLLRHVGDEFGAPVPSSALDQLARTPRRTYEAIGYAAARNGKRRLPALLLHWERYRRLGAERRGRGGFVAYLLAYFGLERPRELLAYGVRRRRPTRRA